jgi:hypothetical protein
MTFAKRALRRRVIALVAAYAIALANLLASFGAAQAAAEAASAPDPGLCHSATDQPAPLSDESNGKICLDCCIGCLGSVSGGAPPPAGATVTVAETSFTRLVPLTQVAVFAAAHSSAHRSRGPPPAV